MFLGSFTLVTAEFLPPGVLTALATDLGVPKGVVGLSVSAIPAGGSYARGRTPDRVSRPMSRRARKTRLET
ncbi:hypothetical protein ACWZHB_30385 [Nocardia sp. FBN12]|uniref:hypothetical protein n=1 Tax=Nocardia sp. FBN12 TaxID=3419766 RepID=UPI003D018EE1